MLVVVVKLVDRQCIEELVSQHEAGVLHEIACLLLQVAMFIPFCPALSIFMLVLILVLFLLELGHYVKPYLYVLVVVILQTRVPSNCEVLILVLELVDLRFILLGFLAFLHFGDLIAQENLEVLLYVLEKLFLLDLGKVGRGVNQVNLYVLEVACELLEGTEDVTHHLASSRAYFDKVDGLKVARHQALCLTLLLF